VLNVKTSLTGFHY